MPFRTVKLLPGVDIESSPTLNQIKLAASNLIRYYGGLVQKLGGWARMSSQTLIGICRGLHGWADLNNNTYVAAGTEQRLQVLTGGSLLRYYACCSDQQSRSRFFYHGQPIGCQDHGV